jgi:putative transposase
VRLWENAWAEFVPFLAFDTEIRTSARQQQLAA